MGEEEKRKKEEEVLLDSGARSLLWYLHVCLWILACSSVRVKLVKKGFLEIARHLFSMLRTEG